MKIFLFFLLIFSMSTYGAEQSGIRGTRYCEIILAKGLTHYSVYNTLGLNDCPERDWKNINISVVKKATQASSVYLNGPRYWVVDGYANTQPSLVHKTMDGIVMREAGTLHIKIMNLIKASSPYYKHEVVRNISWIYKADKPVYELIDVNGDVFVMQSFSTKKSAQTPATLVALEAQLNLPKGWKFKTGILHEEKRLDPSNNIVIVVQDNLDNTYQKAPHDFL